MLLTLHLTPTSTCLVDTGTDDTDQCGDCPWLNRRFHRCTIFEERLEHQNAQWLRGGACHHYYEPESC